MAWALAAMAWTVDAASAAGSSETTECVPR
jgi:hypothetical protein